MGLLIRILVIPLFLVSHISYSQEHYHSMADSIPHGSNIMESVKLNTHQILNQAPGKYEKEFEESFEYREKLVDEILKQNYCLYDKEVYDYIHNIFSHIIESNPQLENSRIGFIVTNFPWPNASSLGNGTFLINIGLLRKLENESQLAFILCHELAHLHLKHAETDLIEHLDKLNSEEFKAKVEEIKNSEFGKYNMIKSLKRDFVYDARRHSRNHETSADSMAFELLKNTKYNLEGTYSGMKVLENIDHYKFAPEINYSSFFGSKDYPFKSRWLEVEESMFGGKVSQEEFFNRDSVMTHPDCKKRARAFQNKLVGYNPVKKNFLQDSTLFEKIKGVSDYEFISGWIKFKSYGVALFHALKHLQEKPNDSYVVIQTSKLLRLIHEYQEKHNLSQYVTKPSVDHEEEYNQLLEFIDNISFSELSQIGYSFHKKYEALTVNEEYLFNLIYFSSYSGKSESFNKYHQLYKSYFPKGQYFTQINNLNHN